MKRLFLHILPVFRLTRVGLAPTAISNIWLVLLISHATPGFSQQPLGRSLVLTALAALGLYVFGMVLNDLLDARRDHALSPQKPIPSGQIGMTAAAILAILALILALAAGAGLGMANLLMTGICAALILFYNAVAKHLAGVGVLTLGLIRAMNMLIANPSLLFGWPLWLAMSHVIGLSSACHRLEGKTPRLEGMHLWLVTGGWAFATVVLLNWLNQPSAPFFAAEPWLWVGPVIAAGAFLVTAVQTCDRAGSERQAGQNLMRIGLLWLMVYDAAWLFSAGLWRQGLLIAGLGLISLGLMALTRRLQAMFQAMKVDLPPHDT